MNEEMKPGMNINNALRNPAHHGVKYLMTPKLVIIKKSLVFTFHVY